MLSCTLNIYQTHQDHSDEHDVVLSMQSPGIGSSVVTPVQSSGSSLLEDVLYSQSPVIEVRTLC